MKKMSEKEFMKKLEGFAGYAMTGAELVLQGEFTREQFLRQMSSVCERMQGRIVVTEFPADAIPPGNAPEVIAALMRTPGGMLVDVDCCIQEGPFTCTWLVTPVAPAWLRNDSFPSN
jgi:hypothetical protein